MDFTQGFVLSFLNEQHNFTAWDGECNLGPGEGEN